MSEELQSQSQHQQHKPSRINLQELRNCDLVSRLLAATPPYLYSSPAGPNNYFFSEMLRSLVQSRVNDQANRKPSHIPPNPPPPIRRSRKRLWTGQQHRSSIFDAGGSSDYKDLSSADRNQLDKPLELTNKNFQLPKYQKSESPKILVTENSTGKMSELSPSSRELKNIPASYNESIPNQSNLLEPPAAEIPPSDLVLPPPPPMWYPPLYPPYGIDPLHFFIDLRVSGHIYDRKKENISPTAVTENNNSVPITDSELIIAKHRHGSAFSVPPSRQDKTSSSVAALNLTFPATNTEKNEEISKFYESHDCKDKELTKNTNYVLQNLPKIYTNLTHQTTVDERNSIHSEETTDSKSDFDVQDTDATNKDDVQAINSPGSNYDDMSDVVIVDGKSN